MNSRVKKIVLLVAPIAVIVVGGWFVPFRVPEFERAPLPVPNGYDDFVRAGQILAVDPAGYQDAPIEELKAMTASNASALAKLKGHPPESAVDLVPGYLNAVPTDPVTGDPMKLQPSTAN